MDSPRALSSRPSSLSRRSLLALAFLSALLAGCGGGGGGSSSSGGHGPNVVRQVAPAGAAAGTFGSRAVTVSFSGSTLNVTAAGTTQAVDFSPLSPTGIGRVVVTPSAILAPCDQGVLALDSTRDAQGAYAGVHLYQGYAILSATPAGSALANPQGSPAAVRDGGVLAPFASSATAGSVVSASAAGNVAAYVLDDGTAWVQDLAGGSATKLSDAPGGSPMKGVLVAAGGGLVGEWLGESGQGGLTFWDASHSAASAWSPTTTAYGGLHLTSVSGDGRSAGAMPDGTEEFAVFRRESTAVDMRHVLLQLRQDLSFPGGVDWLNSGGTVGRAAAQDGATYEFAIPQG